MAGVTSAPMNKLRVRDQFVAILRMRWQVLFHSLRTVQGKLEVVSRVMFGIMATFGGLGGAVGLGAGAFYLAAHHMFDRLAFVLWPVMLFWQLFPVMSNAFSGAADSTNLVRFPLSYRSYYLIQLAEGLIGPTALIPCLWLGGITLGVGLGNSSLLPATLIVLGAFALVNLLLSCMILTWVERWMAQRRTREIFGLIFFLAMMSLQLLGPAMDKVAKVGSKNPHRARAIMSEFSVVQRALPPGAAAQALSGVAKSNFGSGALYLCVLGAYGAAFGSLFGIRIRAQYRGEVFSDAARKDKTKIDRRLRIGWDVFGLPGPIAAMVEKEVRYLSRNGQMLFAMLSPVLLVVLFRFQSQYGNPLMRTSTRAFQVGTAFAVLSTMNLFQNSFGGDGGGVQLLYAAPVSFRDLILGKNFAHAAVGLVEISLVAVALAFFGLMPPIAVITSTLAAAAFAMISLATAGNVLSLYFPKKIQFGRFNRQQGSPVAVFASMFGIFGIFGLSALVLFISPMLGSIWIATGIMLLLACLAAIPYLVVLKRVDGIALSRREKVLQEVCKV